MDFEYSPRTQDLLVRLKAFMNEHIFPNDDRFLEEAFGQPRWEGAASWKPVPFIDGLKEKARAAGLWNLFCTEAEHGPGLSNLEYAPLAEEMGRSLWSSEVFNCSAPDTGNMEALIKFATPAQKKRWLEPLLKGEIRSGFIMTEPQVASSDATNIQARIERDGDHYVVNARKWFSSGVGDSRCRILIFMGKTDPGNPNPYLQQSMVLIPMDTPGVKVERMMPLFGYEDAPHGHAEMSFTNVRVPVENILAGEGRGFEIAQARLGGGRIHHCMRLIGQAERALESMCRRLDSRVAFGKKLSEQTVWFERIAESRAMIDQARFLTLHAAWMMDRVGTKGARKEIALIKVVGPRAACQIIDWAMQAHGSVGMTNDFHLGFSYAWARALRFIDGPDEVHRNQLGRDEIRKYRTSNERAAR
jgi:acyl-CoA dehydrogenase